MARSFSSATALCLFLLLVAVSVDAEPKAKKVKCQDKSFQDCYHRQLYCPDSCLRTCKVDCNSCQPICPTSLPPPPSPSPPAVPKTKKVKCSNQTYPSCYQKPLYCPESCPNKCKVDCASCQPICPPPPPPPPPPVPKTKKVKCTNQTYPSCYHKPLYCPESCPNSCKVDCASCQPICQPPPKPKKVKCHDHTYTGCYNKDLYCPQSCAEDCHADCASCQAVCNSVLPPPTSLPGKAKCKNKWYPNCYGMYQNCPSDCPHHCEVDCVTCRPVCDCNKPGAVCQDPRFIGGDGITFYFHGKKDNDFCLVTDSNLHINAHFIGRRNENMKRDFTWVQSLGVLFDTHKLFIGAKKTSTWDDSVDRLSLAFDGEPILLSEEEGAKWQSTESPIVTITRTRDTNAVVIEVEGNFKIKTAVVPITEKDSLIHNYGITQEDCFAHLDLSFKFYTLTGDVNGVLGQTYASNYISRAKMGVAMPVLGGEKVFASSSLFANDCAVARFTGKQIPTGESSENIEYQDSSCVSGMNGRGVVCKRQQISLFKLYL